MMTFNKVKKCRASLIQRATRHSSLRLRSPHPFAQILIDSLWLLAPAADLDFDRDFQNDSAQQRLILTRVGIFGQSGVRIFTQWTIWLMICLLSTKRLLGTVYFPHNLFLPFEEYSNYEKKAAGKNILSPYEDKCHPCSGRELSSLTFSNWRSIDPLALLV